MCLNVTFVSTLLVLLWNRIVFDQFMYFDKSSLYLIVSKIIPTYRFSSLCAMKRYRRSIG